MKRYLICKIKSLIVSMKRGISYGIRGRECVRNGIV